MDLFKRLDRYFLLGMFISVILENVIVLNLYGFRGLLAPRIYLGMAALGVLICSFDTVHDLMRVPPRPHPGREDKDRWILGHRALYAIYLLVLLALVARYLWLLDAARAVLIFGGAFAAELVYALLVKRVPCLKPIYAAFFFSANFIWLPAYVGGATGWSLRAFAACFLVMVARETYWDIKDHDEDVKNGVRSVPAVFGIRPARQLAVGCLALSVLLTADASTALAWSYRIYALRLAYITLDPRGRGDFYEYYLAERAIALLAVAQTLLSRLPRALP